MFELLCLGCLFLVEKVYCVGLVNEIVEEDVEMVVLVCVKEIVVKLFEVMIFLCKFLCGDMLGFVE